MWTNPGLFADQGEVEGQDATAAGGDPAAGLGEEGGGGLVLLARVRGRKVLVDVALSPGAKSAGRQGGDGGVRLRIVDKKCGGW